MEPTVPTYCAHCGALVYSDSKRCPQCRRFPVRLHTCPKCKIVHAEHEDRCKKCGRLFAPEGDWL